MALSEKKAEQILKYTTLLTLTFMIGTGLYEVLAPVRPFWVDEWRIIYNLKFKSAHDLYGPLDFMQQFPRTYLLIIKWFTQKLDYSYFSLRLPSFLIGVSTIILSYQLMNRLFTGKLIARLLFVLIIISASTFTEYFVQVKQYTMDIFLSVVAISQLLTLLQLREGESISKLRYILLCAGLLVCPFFSYTYPIVIAPVFTIMAIECINILKDATQEGKTLKITRICFPLLLCMTGVFLFYRTDVTEVMKDCGMKQYWGDIMMINGFHIKLFFKNFVLLFAQVGSGMFFQIIFAILGICAFVSYFVRLTISNNNHPDMNDQVALYCVSLLALVLLLFGLGKLPVGEPRLNSFTVASIAILVIYFLMHLPALKISRIMVLLIVLLLFAGSAGHIFTSFKKSMTGAEHQKKLNIYKQTEAAVSMAIANNVPLIVGSAVAYPYDTIINFPNSQIRASILCYPHKVKEDNELTTGINQPADWIAQSLPAYQSGSKLTVYAIDDLNSIDTIIKKLPQNIRSVVVTDGSSVKLVRLKE